VPAVPQRLRNRARRAPRRAALAAVVALATLPSITGAKNGAFRDSAHGSRETGVRRVPGVPRGECAHCHGAPRDAAGRKEPGGHARLFAQNDNALCFECHRTPRGSWIGDRQYEASVHGASPAVIWPGPEPRGRPAADSGKCVNCHDPHGVKDDAGLVPSMLRLRGVALCLGCHTGNSGPDVASALGKTYRHPLAGDAAPGARAGAAELAPLRIVVAGGAGAPDASSCSGCHNPHAAALETAGPRLAAGPRALLGVSRARISNGPAGAPPTRALVAASDATPFREWEVCFKCHAGGAARPAHGEDLGAALNPANRSFHPVEAQGRNATIERRAFTQGWSADRLVTCSDCHSSDDELTRGPHGSSYPHLLAKRYLTRAASQPMLETDLCFECHAHRTYGDPLATAERAYSRFAGHATHVARGASCWACHEAHGSATLPSLLALRSPGLGSFVQEHGGGSCSVSCHVTTPATVSYRVTYPR
jgi:predicted CXXCH cytochrome family protein